MECENERMEKNQQGVRESQTYRHSAAAVTATAMAMATKSKRPTSILTV